MWNLAKILWATAQVMIIIATFCLFFTLMPWVAAIPIQELPKELSAVTLPKGCPAVTIGHGQVHCQWLGLVSSNVPLFSVMLMGLVLCCGFLLFTGITERGFSLRRKQVKWRANGA